MSGQLPPNRLPPSPDPGEAPPRWSDGERTPMFPSAPELGSRGAWPAIRGALLTLGAFLVLILAGVGLITMVQRAAILLCR